MIEAQLIAESAVTEIADAPDTDSLERIRRDFVGEEEGRLTALRLNAHPDHLQGVLDAIRRVEEALVARAAALEKKLR